MGNSLVSRKNGRSNLADVEREAPAATDSGRSEARPEWMRVLHRVPPRLREQNKKANDPSVVSLGPYHHGQPQFHEFEEYKDELVHIMLEADHRRQLFRANILARIGDIRHFYGGLSRDVYEDEALAEMMLRDACVVFYLVEMFAANKENRKKTDRFLLQRLGLFQMSLMTDRLTSLLSEQRRLLLQLSGVLLFQHLHCLHKQIDLDLDLDLDLLVRCASEKSEQNKPC